jgi:glucan 1,3-beta-glucosidase
MLKAVVLGLSTCASALNARSYSADVPQHNDASWKTAPETSPYPSLSSLKVSSSTTDYSAVISSSVGATTYAPQSTSKNPTVAPYPTNANGTSTSSAPLSTETSGSCAPYWLENIKHQGVASFNPNPSNYTVFRNVKDFGARGDGVTDDTAAIQRAVTQGNRCGPSACESSTNTPAIVYFPEGTYLISSSIIDYYYTQVWPS